MFSLNRLFQNFVGALQEGLQIIQDYPRRMRERNWRARTVSMMKVFGMIALVPVSMILTEPGPWSMVALLGKQGLYHLLS